MKFWNKGVTSNRKKNSEKQKWSNHYTLVSMGEFEGGGAGLGAEFSDKVLALHTRAWLQSYHIANNRQPMISEKNA